MNCPYTQMGCDSHCKAYILQTCPFDGTPAEVKVVEENEHVCHFCQKVCSSKAGLSAHIRFSHK
jgi:hypothetical protein